ncbi:hypothetical protein OF83DRAFT_1096462 [Amylostereum chailletii]|nr:hypothetical protein OF83DRAFT_1096462 [Amylostereum chailletii]
MTTQVKAFVRPCLNAGHSSNTPNVIRSLPELIEFNAQHNSEHVFGAQMRSGNGPSQWLRMTFSDLQTAAERASAWLMQCGATRERLSRDKSVPPVAIFLGSDITIFLYMAALLRIGTPVLLLSARLTPLAIVHLIKATSPSTVLISAQTSRTAKETNLLLDSPSPLFLNTLRLPKPIYHAHAYLLSYAACHRIPEQPDSLDFNVSTLPLYHGFGLLAPSLSLSIGMPFVLPSASAIPTARSTIASLELTGARSMFSVPSILEDIVRLPDGAGIEVLQKLDFIAIGGAPMKESVALTLASNGVNLLNHWGATEIGAIAPIQRPPPGYDFHYLIPRDDIGLQIVPVADTERTFRLIGQAPGWKEPFEVQDLLEAHPHDPTQFRILGRTDDLIVLGTGEKVRPSNMEHAVSEHPNVKAALVFGDGQFSLGLLVELQVHDIDVARDALVASIDPFLVRGNTLMDKHAKITKDMLVFTYADVKPLIRTDKGSLARKETFAAFDQEIKACYYHAKVSLSDPFPLPTAESGEALSRALRALVASMLNVTHFSDDADFFEAGMDSLQAARLRRAILNGLRATPDLPTPINDLEPDFVFENSSFSKLLQSVIKVMDGNIVSKSEHHLEGRRVQKMEEIVMAYSEELMSYASHAERAHEARRKSTHTNGEKNEERVVLLTGSTGSLGCMLLARIAMDPSIKKVICLSRAQEGFADVLARQKETMKQRGAVLESTAWTKVSVFESDMSRADFGLSHDHFQELLDVTHIVHNAWPMNFNRTLTSFSAHIKVLCHLIRLALLSVVAHPSKTSARRILFSSSIAVVGRFPLLHPGPVPEDPQPADATADFGYPEAKWVCERLLQTATALYGKSEEGTSPLLATSSVRIGQMTGPEGSGVWNENEHFPLIVRASQKINAVPELHGSLSWMPVNRAAAVISELLFSKPFRPTYHLENPSRQPLGPVLDDFADLLGGLPRLPFNQWLNQVRALGSDPETNPAHGILVFLEKDFVRMAAGSVVLGTNKAREDSATMRTSGALERWHLADLRTKVTIIHRLSSLRYQDFKVMQLYAVVSSLFRADCWMAFPGI